MLMQFNSATRMRTYLAREAAMPGGVALVLCLLRGRLRLMAMVEYFANTPTGALGNFACALGRADTDVLAGDGGTLTDIASGVDWVKCDKVARTFSDALGRCSSALSGSFADVSGAPADVASGAALLGLRLEGRLSCLCGLRRGLGLAVLTGGVLAADGKCEREERDSWFWECDSHGLSLPRVR
jgi:hypothetical protein